MATTPSEFTLRLEPLLRLGAEHPAVRSVIAALDAEWVDLSVRATDQGTRGEDRAWWSGGATAVAVLRDELREAVKARALPDTGGD